MKNIYKKNRSFETIFETDHLEQIIWNRSFETIFGTRFGTMIQNDSFEMNFGTIFETDVSETEQFVSFLKHCRNEISSELCSILILLFLLN